MCKTLSAYDSFKRNQTRLQQMEVNAGIHNHARDLATVPEAHFCDLGVTDVAVQFFNNFVMKVAASTRMGKIMKTPQTTAEMGLRRSSRLPGAGRSEPPKAAAAQCRNFEPMPKVIASPLPQIIFPTIAYTIAAGFVGDWYPEIVEVTDFEATARFSTDIGNASRS